MSQIPSDKSSSIQNCLNFSGFGDCVGIIVKLTALALIVSGIAMVVLYFLYQYPLLIPSYISFGVGGGLLFFSYLVSCVSGSAKFFKEILHEEVSTPNGSRRPAVKKAPPPPKPKQVDAQGKEIKEEKVVAFSTKSVTELFKEQGIVGLPEEFNTKLQPLIYARGPLKSFYKGRTPDRGILLYGPPGTGKTRIAKAFGKILGVPQERITTCIASEFQKRWHNATVENVLKEFDPAIEEMKAHGEDADLYILFIDEIDALLAARKNATDGASQEANNVVNAFLGMLDGPTPLNNMIVIATTNRLEELDKSVLRPGRLAIHLKVDLPNAEGREAIFRNYLRTAENVQFDEDIDCQALSQKTEGFSGADIEYVVKQAAEKAFKDALDGQFKNAQKSGDGAFFQLTESQINEVTKQARVTSVMLNELVEEARQAKLDEEKKPHSKLSIKDLLEQLQRSQSKDKDKQ